MELRGYQTEHGVFVPGVAGHLGIGVDAFGVLGSIPAQIRVEKDDVYHHAVTGAIVNAGLYLIGFENVWVYLVLRFFANFPAG
jgi:hypothetical protein